MEELVPKEEVTFSPFPLEVQAQPNQKQDFADSINHPHRHVSLKYGIEFQSKVLLYARERVSEKNQPSIEVIPKEKLLKKVACFLEAAIQNEATLEQWVKSFKQLDEEMNLSVRKSARSLTSELSENPSSGSGDSEKGEGNEDGSGKNIRKIQNNSMKEKQNGGSLPKLRKQKTSMMSKCNRISLVDAINVSEFQNHLKNINPIEAIQSSESVNSESEGSLNQFKSRDDLTSDPSQKQSSQQSSLTSLKRELKMQKNKKISIMISEDLSEGSEFFSVEDFISLRDLKLPQLVLSASLLDNYFQCFSPFLVNLALCLLCKCLARSSIGLKEDNAGWLLGISTIVAYKVYYDEPIQGLMDFFADSMQMQTGNLKRLERWFLSSVSYQVVISSQQYQNMMFRLLSQKE